MRIGVIRISSYRSATDILFLCLGSKFAPHGSCPEPDLRSDDILAIRPKNFLRRGKIERFAAA